MSFLPISPADLETGLERSFTRDRHSRDEDEESDSSEASDASSDLSPRYVSAEDGHELSYGELGAVLEALSDKRERLEAVIRGLARDLVESRERERYLAANLSALELQYDDACLELAPSGIKAYAIDDTLLASRTVPYMKDDSDDGRSSQALEERLAQRESELKSARKTIDALKSLWTAAEDKSDTSQWRVWRHKQHGKEEDTKLADQHDEIHRLRETVLRLLDMLPAREITNTRSALFEHSAPSGADSNAGDLFDDDCVYVESPM